MSKTSFTNFSLPRFAAAMLLGVGSLFGQTPSFEVASIKPSEPIAPAMIQSGKVHLGMKIHGARVDIGNFRLIQLIMTAWDVRMYQVQGPPWLTGQAFDIVANLPEGATKEQVPPMLQKLLADRFKLQVHTDTQPHAVYALVVAKGGSKLKESAPAANAVLQGVTGSSTASINVGKNGGGTVVTDGAGHKQTMAPSPDGKMLHFEVSGATMAELAAAMAPLSDQPILDETDLKGRYDVTMDISMQEVMAAARSVGANVPPPAAGETEVSEPGGSLFTAIKSMGLKLERRKEPMLRVVVDHCEKMPTDN